MKNVFILLVIFAIVISCKKDNQLETEISNINININVERFDKLFAESSINELPKLKKAYPFMFSKKYNDSLWIAWINDTLQQQLNAEVDNAFIDSNLLEAEIVSLFQHLKYNYKTFQTPRIITVTSDVDYRNKTIVTDSIVLIALDTYLGADHEFYVSIHHYLKQNFRSSQIVADLATQYAEQEIFQVKRKSFLDEMVYYGKVLYFKDVMIPFKEDEEKIGYTKAQLDWAIANESNIWRFFVEEELLFDSSPKLVERFINPAPFSKFNLELDSESPGRLGQYLGWQIVRSYMKSNDVTLQQMLTTNADDIFNNARFKPRK